MQLFTFFLDFFKIILSIGKYNNSLYVSFQTKCSQLKYVSAQRPSGAQRQSSKIVFFYSAVSGAGSVSGVGRWEWDS